MLCAAESSGWAACCAACDAARASVRAFTSDCCFASCGSEGWGLAACGGPPGLPSPGLPSPGFPSPGLPSPGLASAGFASAGAPSGFSPAGWPSACAASRPFCAFAISPTAAFKSFCASFSAAFSAACFASATGLDCGWALAFSPSAAAISCCFCLRASCKPTGWSSFASA
ncbi:MAG: hypothetical protein EXS27_04050 [Pedosphaera sp.]|nr:hypothetical protein [Pedosphaera sp.]